MSHQLEQLFKRCDTRGTGYIDQCEFRDLCRGFEIDDADADIIFFDLDHDGDGRISFEDFSFGFRDFITPGSRRGSIQLGLASPSPTKKASFSGFGQDAIIVEDFDLDTLQKQKNMEKKHAEAREAWKGFADRLGKDDIKHVLSVSSDKIFTLYEELQTSDAPPHLLNQYEEVISALMTDVKKMEEETRKMEEKMARERENHTTHLKNIEAELDVQVAKVEMAAREKARRDHDSEKRELQEKMEQEIAQLQSQLKIFQKIDTYINKEKDESQSKESQKKLDNAVSENRDLKASLGQTQTNLALLRAELNQMRSQYDAKCYELNEERENKIEFLYEFDNLNRQLDLLRDANQKLQDTNDGLRSVVDIGALNSPRVSSRHEFSNLIMSPDVLRQSPDLELMEKLPLPYGRQRSSKYSSLVNGSRTPSDNGGGSVYDSDSIRSRGSEGYNRPKVTEAHFGIRRMLDDFNDSGHSSVLPVDDFRDEQTLDAETREALQSLEDACRNVSPPPQTYPTPRPRSSRERGRGPEQDRDISEVRQSTTESQSSPASASASDLDLMKVTDHKQTPREPPRPAPRKASDAARPVSGLPLSRPIKDLEPTGPPDRTYKVVFAGDAAVGKTSFINRITKGMFMPNLSSTLGVDFQVKTIRVDERNIAIQLWDTAGQERFRSVTRSYFRRADGVMLLYDVTSDRSFLSVRQWIDAVDDVSEKRIPIMLCANKVDLRAEAAAQGRRVVSRDEGEKMARDHSAIFIETSAKDGNNVIDALVQLSRDMCSSEDVEVQTSALKIRDDEGKKKACCKK